VSKVWKYPKNQKREDIVGLLQEYFCTKTFTKTIDKALFLASRHIKYLEAEQKIISKRQQAIAKDLEF